MGAPECRRSARGKHVSANTFSCSSSTLSVSAEGIKERFSEARESRRRINTEVDLNSRHLPGMGRAEKVPFPLFPVRASVAFLLPVVVEAFIQLIYSKVKNDRLPPPRICTLRQENNI